MPLNMVLEENGRAYIGMQGEGANVKRLEVTVLGRDDKYAIIKETADDGLLAIGLPLVRALGSKCPKSSGLLPLLFCVGRNYKFNRRFEALDGFQLF